MDRNICKVCAVCSEKAQQICGGCGDISYCSREHQKKDWNVHKSQCKPYKILTDPKLGRYGHYIFPSFFLIGFVVTTLLLLFDSYMAASRNIKAGEIIFRERALAVGPKQGCLPLCLSCYSHFHDPDDGGAPVYRCPGCNFPFCDELCAKAW